MSDPQALKDEALSLYQKKEFNAAAALYQEVVEQNPRDWEAWRMLGFTLHADGQYEKAVKAFESAIRANTQDPDNYFGRALAHQALGDHYHAIGDFENAIHRNPHHQAAKQASAVSYTTRGRELLAEANLLGAEQYFEKAHRHLQTEETYKELQSYYASAGQSGKAMLIEQEWNARHSSPAQEPEPPAPAPQQTVSPQASPAQTAGPVAPQAQTAPSQTAPTTAQASPQPVAQPNFFPCPKCAKAMGINATICPHCGHDVRRPVDPAQNTRRMAAERLTWQEKAYRIMCWLWIVIGSIQIIAGLINGDVAGLVQGGLQILVGTCLLQEQTWAVWLAYIVCILNLIYYTFLILGGLALATTLPVLGILIAIFGGFGVLTSALFIYLLRYVGDL